MGTNNIDLKEGLIVNIVNKSTHPLPEYATALSAGMDLRAFITEPITIKPLERVLVPTGIYIQLDKGFEAQIRPRSGLAYKYGITVFNSPGTIDADYIGEIKVILINLSGKVFTVQDGERIAQMVIAKHENVKWRKKDKLESSERGEGGFGSTGTK